MYFRRYTLIAMNWDVNIFIFIYKDVGGNSNHKLNCECVGINVIGVFGCLMFDVK